MIKTSIKTAARTGGLLYLLQATPGVFGILYVPKVLVVPVNMAVADSNILVKEF